MGRTLPSITRVFQEEEAALQRFRRALRRSDQQALDELLAAAHQHLSAAAYAAHPWPFELLLLAILIEEHKQLRALQSLLQFSSSADATTEKPQPGNMQPTDAGEGT